MKTETTPEEFLARLDALSDGQLISQKHLAAILSVSESLLEKSRVKGGFIPHFKIAKGAVRYQLGTVRNWLAGRTVSSTAEAQVRLSAYIALPHAEIGAYRPILLPWAYTSGAVQPFIDSMNHDVDEIIWLMPSAFQDRLETRLLVAEKHGTEATLRKAIADERSAQKAGKKPRGKGI